jgi:hypothetical protein
MFRLGVTLAALAVLFGLTSLALPAAGLLGHPGRVAAVLVGAFALGVILLLE